MSVFSEFVPLCCNSCVMCRDLEISHLFFIPQLRHASTQIWQWFKDYSFALPCQSASFLIPRAAWRETILGEAFLAETQSWWWSILPGMHQSWAEEARKEASSRARCSRSAMTRCPQKSCCEKKWEQVNLAKLTSVSCRVRRQINNVLSLFVLLIIKSQADLRTSSV